MNTFIVLLIVLLLALLFSVLGIRICIFYNLFHIPCVGCGMTRALKLILRFKIDDLLKEIELIDESIQNINTLCKYETCTDENGVLIFNEQLLNEFSEFIFIDEYNDSSFTEGESLIEKGREVLQKKSKPTTMFI